MRKGVATLTVTWTPFVEKLYRAIEKKKIMYNILRFWTSLANFLASRLMMWLFPRELAYDISRSKKSKPVVYDLFKVGTCI